MRDTKTEEEIINGFAKYCKELGYGSFTVEVIDGKPLKITNSKQDIRLDLPNSFQDTTMK